MDDHQEHKFRQSLFYVFLAIFTLTSVVTIIFVVIHLYQTMWLEKDIEIPTLLSGLITATVLEVAAGIVAVYKQVFNVSWGKSPKNKQNNNSNSSIEEHKISGDRPEDDSRYESNAVIMIKGSAHKKVE